jgi:hypothetical protein
MAVTSCKETREGRSGQLRAESSTYTRSFLVTTDDPEDSVITVALGVYTAFGVRAGAAHNEDVTARCIEMSPVDTGTGLQWIVACQYSNATEHRDKQEDPLDDAAIIGPWDSEGYQEVAVVDRDDKPNLNSAGDPYDPPLMKDFSRRNVTVRKNVASVPSWYLDYEDAVNSDTFTIGGLTIPPGYAKCKRTSVSEKKTRNGIDYYEVTTVIQFAKKKWTRKVLDQGFHIKWTFGASSGRSKIQMLNEDGEFEYPVSPVPLNGTGGQLLNPTPDTAVYREHDIEDELPFSVLPLS